MAAPAPPDLDPELLSAAVTAAGLAGRTSGRYRATHIGRFSNDVWRLDLEDGPALIAKQPFRLERTDDHPDVEHTFYQTITRLSPDHLSLPIPRYVGVLNGVLLLEHCPLEDFSFQQGATQQHAERAIEALADWHAAWWGRAPAASWLPRLDDPNLLASNQQNYDAAWTQHRTQLLANAPEFRSLGDALVGRLASTLGALAEPATLIHGDAHAENLPLTQDGRVLILDWQDPRIGNPGYDLAVFLSMSFRQADRPKQEAALIERYLARLTAAGCHWPDPWLGYRLGLLRRVAQIVELAAVGIPSLPWVFRRSAMAALASSVGELIR